MSVVNSYLRLPVMDDWNVVLAQLQADAYSLLEQATQIYLQLAALFDTCKEDPSLLWTDPYIRQQSLPIFAFVLALVSVIVFYTTVTSKSRRERALKAESEEKDRKRVILQKLLSVLTPTRSIWSESYWLHAQKCIKSGVYSLPVQAFVDDLIKGEVELRDPTTNLPALLMGQLVVQELPVQVHSNPSFHRRVTLARSGSKWKWKVRYDISAFDSHELNSVQDSSQAMGAF